MRCINLQKCKLCNTNLNRLNYYYDDDWGYKGNEVWDSQDNEKELFCCPKCGLVYALKIIKED